MRTEGLNGFDIALPAVPQAALQGVPPAADLPDAAARRRYGEAVIAALTVTPSWQLETHDRARCSLPLRIQAFHEDWPMLGTASAVSILVYAVSAPDPSWPLLGLGLLGLGVFVTSPLESDGREIPYDAHMGVWASTCDGLWPPWTGRPIPTRPASRWKRCSPSHCARPPVHNAFSRRMAISSWRRVDQR